MFFGVALWGLRKKRARAAATILILLAAFLWCASPAQAQFVFRDLEEYVAASDDIVAGRVVAAESRWADTGMRIVTDVTIQVDDVMKGRLNKSGKVHFSLPTGRVGAIGRFSPQLPTFREGEEIVLFLENRGVHGYMVVGGITGKFNVRTDPDTGEKTVYAGSSAGKVRLARAAAKMEKEAGDTAESSAEAESSGEQKPKTVALEDFKEYLRDVDREQRKAR
jgi:hypothetical protein